MKMQVFLLIELGLLSNDLEVAALVHLTVREKLLEVMLWLSMEIPLIPLTKSLSIQAL